MLSLFSASLSFSAPHAELRLTPSRASVQMRERFGTSAYDRYEMRDRRYYDAVERQRFRDARRGMVQPTMPTMPEEMDAPAVDFQMPEFDLPPLQLQAPQLPPLPQFQLPSSGSGSTPTGFTVAAAGVLAVVATSAIITLSNAVPDVGPEARAQAMTTIANKATAQAARAKLEVDASEAKRASEMADAKREILLREVKIKRDAAKAAEAELAQLEKQWKM